MLVKKLDFIDVELEEYIKGYIIIAEDEIVVMFDGYKKQGCKSFKNVEELAQELIHTKELLNITGEMLDEEIKKMKNMRKY